MEVADDGDPDAEFIERIDDFGTAAADASLLTVTRTSSEPALASAITWLTVDGRRPCRYWSSIGQQPGCPRRPNATDIDCHRLTAAR